MVACQCKCAERQSLEIMFCWLHCALLERKSCCPYPIILYTRVCGMQRTRVSTWVEYIRELRWGTYRFPPPIFFSFSFLLLHLLIAITLSLSGSSCVCWASVSVLSPQSSFLLILFCLFAATRVCMDVFSSDFFFFLNLYLLSYWAAAASS